LKTEKINRMSFKIFTLQLLGKIKSVETIESRRKSLFDDYNEFLKVEQSDELKKYQSLEKEVNSAEFKKLKSETEALRFKGSREFLQLKEFGLLQKKGSIRDYLTLVQSGEVDRFATLKEGGKVAEFTSLKKYVTEGSYEKEKKEIKQQVFKGSAEANQLREFNRLGRQKGIKIYLALFQSPELKKLEADPKSNKLKLYQETLGSSQLLRYNELKTLVNSEDFKKREAFLKDSTKFEKSETHKKYLRFKQLQSDSDIQFVLKFEKSRLYKNYLKVHGSPDIKRYYELKELTGLKEFAERKVYLEDNKKWEKTDEFKREQQYAEMKNLPHLVRYFKYFGTPVFSFLNEWEVIFSEDFDSKLLNSEKWATIPYIADKMMGENFAVAGDLSVFTNGKNLKTGGKLTIDIRKEKVACKVWQMPAGLVPTTLEYTSDMVSTWNSFEQEDGIFEAKIRFAPHRQIVSSFFLSGNENTTRINLLEMGAENRVGVLHRANNGKAEVNGLEIGNLKQGNWYIFSVEKKGNNITWKINETEVLTLSSGDFNQKLHLNASSIVIHDMQASQLPAPFEIEWVKCLRRISKGH